MTVTPGLGAGEGTFRRVRIDLGHPAIDLSPVLAETIAPWALSPNGEFGEHRRVLCLVRRQRRYALLGPRDRRLPDLAAGIAYLEGQGLAAFMRTGGGSLVVLDEDCLSFALAWPCRNPGHVADHFVALSEPVRMALAALGVPAAIGQARGSYCEGPTDLVGPDGRKVAGMSQALRNGVAMVSGMLLVRQDADWATSVVAGFERFAGGDPGHLRADAVTSLARLRGRGLSVDEVADVLEGTIRIWAGSLGLREAKGAGTRTLLPEEWLRAESLITLRRVGTGGPTQVLTTPGT